ncbi:MAG: glycosyltransferase [Clostridia bacterium]|nr:glycosyltransferase [Clostridia bacterium]
MKYLFIGYIYDQDAEKFLLKKNGHHLQPQNNQYAWGIINGLNECTGANVDVIGSISCGSYPKNSQMLIVKRNFFVSSYGIDYVGFINFYDIREMCRYYGFLKKIRKYIKETNDEITIIVDGMCHTFTKLIHRLKREYKDRIKIVLIVLDLVGKYAIQYPNKFQNWYYQRHAAEQMEAARLADGYILLTEAMKGPLNIGNKPYTVIEGFLPKTEDDTDLPEIKRSKNKVVLYTGSLNKKFGLIDLLEQFVTIDDDSYELWICGPQMGDIKIVEAYAKKDRRIKYLGFLPKSKILKLQR